MDLNGLTGSGKRKYNFKKVLPTNLQQTNPFLTVFYARLSEIEREKIVGLRGYSFLDRMFPKWTKCDYFDHSGVGQVDVSKHKTLYIKDIV